MSTKKSGSKTRSKKTNRYPVEFKLQAVRLFTEEKYTAEMVAEESDGTINKWTKVK